MSKKFESKFIVKEILKKAEEYAIKENLQWAPEHLKKKPIEDLFNHFYSIPCYNVKNR